MQFYNTKRIYTYNKIDQVRKWFETVPTQLIILVSTFIIIAAKEQTIGASNPRLEYNLTARILSICLSYYYTNILL
jgi:hypothetical protein